MNTSSPENNTSERESFTSNFGLLMSMIGVAVGLGNIWRFPYMVGRFGGSAFVLFYIIVVVFIGIPALIAEWTLGRKTRRGSLGAFEKGGLPLGKYAGYFFFVVVFFAGAYYTNLLGWVLFYNLGEIASVFTPNFDQTAILPPQSGYDLNSIFLQIVFTIIVLFLCGFVVAKGINKGIEKISKFIIPSLLTIMIILLFYSLFLEGASSGIKWYIGSFRLEDLTGSVMAAALGQGIFSLSLGGTFMVIYGSYLEKNADITKNSVFTASGDVIVGLLAGFIIFPVVFSFGLSPGSGPDLIFVTLPEAFSVMNGGWLFGFLFFSGLFAAAFLSNVAAIELLVGGILDNSEFRRRKTTVVVCIIIFFLAIPSMINMDIFMKWDLTFGSGMQVLGSLFAVITVAWCIKKADFINEVNKGKNSIFHEILYWWLRLVIPSAIILVGIYWLTENLF
ncbi:MAG: sodium-dependent transporter [bacterium]|nr:sodium-dependent transporter [bacterium]